MDPFIRARLAREGLADLLAHEVLVDSLPTCSGASAALLGLSPPLAERAQALVGELARALDDLSALRRGEGEAPLDGFTLRGDPSPVPGKERGLGGEFSARNAADALRVLSVALAARARGDDPARRVENMAAAALFGEDPAPMDEAARARRADALKLCEGHELYICLLYTSPSPRD